MRLGDLGKAKSNYGYATHLTEVMLLGCVAVRVGSGVKLKWDAERMEFDNETANKFLQHE